MVGLELWLGWDYAWTKTRNKYDFVFLVDGWPIPSNRSLSMRHTAIRSFSSFRSSCWHDKSAINRELFCNTLSFSIICRRNFEISACSSRICCWKWSLRRSAAVILALNSRIFFRNGVTATLAWSSLPSKSCIFSYESDGVMRLWLCYGCVMVVLWFVMVVLR